MTSNGRLLTSSPLHRNTNLSHRLRSHHGGNNNGRRSRPCRNTVFPYEAPQRTSFDTTRIKGQERVVRLPRRRRPTAQPARCVNITITTIEKRNSTTISQWSPLSRHPTWPLFLAGRHFWAGQKKRSFVSMRPFENMENRPACGVKKTTPNLLFGNPSVRPYSLCVANEMKIAYKSTNRYRTVGEYMKKMRGLRGFVRNRYIPLSNWRVYGDSVGRLPNGTEITFLWSAEIMKNKFSVGEFW